MALSGVVAAVASLLWSLLGWVYFGLISVLSSLLPTAVLAVLTSLWGVLVALGVLAGAAVLNLVGVNDVYGKLITGLGDDDTPTERLPVDEAMAVDPEAITDTAGRFSSSAFERVTGLTPPEFIHLFVEANGGRVWQSTLNSCLPWSKSSVSQHLDVLESNGVLVRVSHGSKNVVCTPEQTPVRSNASADEAGEASTDETDQRLPG